MIAHLAKHKIQYSIAIYAVILLALVFFFLAPRYKIIGNTANSIEETRLDKISMEQRTDDISEIRKEVDKINTNEPLLEKGLLQEHDEVSFIEKLEKISGDSGVDTKIQVVDKSLQQNTESDTGLLNKIGDMPYLNLQVTSSGDFNKLLAFINKIENLDTYLTVYSVKFYKKSETASDLTSSIDVFQESSLITTGQDITAQPTEKLYVDLVIIVYLGK